MFLRKKKQVAGPTNNKALIVNGHSEEVGILFSSHACLIRFFFFGTIFSIPMMDLLVNLAAGSRLNPGGHTLQVLNEETGKLKEYKANQTIGSLCTRREDHKFNYVTVQIVPKKDSKKYTGNNRNAQPFEVRYSCLFRLLPLSSPPPPFKTSPLPQFIMDCMVSCPNCVTFSF